MKAPKKPEPPRHTRPGGRTARVSERLLDATTQLIAQHGIASVTYDAVAKLAGTSRATLYRKWPQRDDLLKDALIRLAELSVNPPDTGNVRRDLIELLCRMGDTLATPSGRAIVNASLVAEENDPIRQLGRDVLEARMAAFQRRIDHAVQTGELPPLDASFFNTMLAGPVFLSVLRDGRPLTREFAQRVADTILDGVRPR